MWNEDDTWKSPKKGLFYWYDFLIDYIIEKRRLFP
jgi:hypothetical protein